MLNLEILKRKGGWPTATFALTLKDNLNQVTPEFHELPISNKLKNNPNWFTWNILREVSMSSSNGAYSPLWICLYFDQLALDIFVETSKATAAILDR